MRIAYESLPSLLSSSSPQGLPIQSSSTSARQEDEKKEKSFDFIKYMQHANDANEEKKSLQNACLYTTEYMRLDGLWRLTKSPSCLEAEGIP
ncbi:hypothetical protein CSUI_011263, partial [Cystoisospora suis]